MGKNKPLNAIKENKTGYLYQAITCVDCQGIIQKGKKNPRRLHTIRFLSYVHFEADKIVEMET